ncbi:MAG TPA: hypothetical protein VF398_11790 [bacterium]
MGPFSWLNCKGGTTAWGLGSRGYIPLFYFPAKTSSKQTASPLIRPPLNQFCTMLILNLGVALRVGLMTSFLMEW